MLQKINWFTKSRRAQNINDDETWNEGGVSPTLNSFDNGGESRATVLTLFEPKSAFEENWAEAKVKNSLRANASKSSHVIIDGTRVDDVRIYENGIVPTVIQRRGTGGGNVPMVFPIDDAREIEKFQNGTGIGEAGAPAYTLDTRQESAVAVVGTLQSRDYKGLNHEGARDGKAIVTSPSTVRRLTPLETERLQGFPDGWTDGQADSNRYKQMGNAVAVPVVEWIVNRLAGTN